MTLQLHDALFVIGAGLFIYAMFALSWQAGLAGIGVAIIAASWIVRGILARKQKRRGK